MLSRQVPAREDATLDASRFVRRGGRRSRFRRGRAGRRRLGPRCACLRVTPPTTRDLRRVQDFTRRIRHLQLALARAADARKSVAPRGAEGERSLKGMQQSAPPVPARRSADFSRPMVAVVPTTTSPRMAAGDKSTRAAVGMVIGHEGGPCARSCRAEVRSSIESRQTGARQVHRDGIDERMTAEHDVCSAAGNPSGCDRRANRSRRRPGSSG